jgi:L-threonylcarbamoyladenylate synthase
MARVNIEEAARRLLKGEVVGIPTETVYGLAAGLSHPEAIESIFSLKGRPRLNPLIVHVADLEQARALSQDWSRAAEQLSGLWPGPLTLLVTARSDRVPEAVRAGLPTVGIRIPAHDLCRDLLRLTGPLVAPSANLSGRPSASRAFHVEQDFGQAFPVLDGGPCSAGLESTIVQTVGEPRLARLGALSAEQIEQLCGLRLSSCAVLPAGEKPICPGQILQHYAPRARLHLCSERTPTRQSIVLGFRNREYGGARLWALGDSSCSAEVAASLYAALRRLDQEQIQEAWIDDLFEERGLWSTIRERMTRAAGSPSMAGTAESRID